VRDVLPANSEGFCSIPKNFKKESQLKCQNEHFDVEIVNNIKNIIQTTVYKTMIIDQWSSISHGFF